MSELNIRRIVCGAYAENAYLLTREGCPTAALIDPGDDYEALSAAIAESGKPLGDILLTHGHFDHCLCAARLHRETGARVHIHPLEAHMLQSESASAYNPGVSREPFTALEPDCPFETDEESTVYAAGTDFTVLHTPGHTHGGVCLLCEDEGILFTGDTVFAAGYGRYDLPTGNLHELLNSLRTLLTLDRTLTAYPGHGEQATMAEIARYFGR